MIKAKTEAELVVYMLCQVIRLTYRVRPYSLAPGDLGVHTF